jgi:hypothetical protein
MKHADNANQFTETDLRLALNEVYPDSNFGAIPVIDQRDALEAYLAFDDGALAEAPHALAEYIRRQRFDCN